MSLLSWYAAEREAAKRAGDSVLPWSELSEQYMNVLFDTPIGRTSWLGPCPWRDDGLDPLPRTLNLVRWVQKEMAKKGAFLHVTELGRFVRVRRLPSGPVKKLSDWLQLPIGESMTLSLAPDTDHIDLASWRSQYLRRTGRGDFRSFVSTDGLLIVERIREAEA